MTNDTAAPSSVDPSITIDPNHQPLELHIATPITWDNVEDQRMALCAAMDDLLIDKAIDEQAMRELIEQFNAQFPKDYPLTLVIYKREKRWFLYWRGRGKAWSAGYVNICTSAIWKQFIRLQPVAIQTRLAQFEIKRLSLEWAYRNKCEAIRALQKWLSQIEALCKVVESN